MYETNSRPLVAPGKAVANRVGLKARDLEVFTKD